MPSIRRSLFALVLLLASACALAANDTPVGVWKTIDDDSGQTKALVQISDHGGTLEGRIIKVLKSDQGPHPLCTKCQGERHNKPVEGMTILWGMRRDGDQWQGGRILDPKKGSIYKCKMRVIDGGKKLKVRGFIGFSLFGRNQVWLRES